jgi:hypothetical protein
VSAQSYAGAAERRRLDEVVSQLRFEGWVVTLEPRGDSLPEALRDWPVDFIAHRDTELLIGEVASRNTAKEERIDLLARRVKQIPNARLQIYWLGDSTDAKPDFHQVQGYIGEARAVSETSPRAGLLMAMAALEGAVAAFAEGVDVKPDMPPRQLLSHLYSLGFIDAPDFNRIGSLYRFRSEIAHLATPREPSPEDILFCLDLAGRMLNNRYVSADRVDDWFLNSSRKADLPSARVPWDTISAGGIEQIVAVLLGCRNQRAMRIRLSQGESGLGVLVPTATPEGAEVYQIKSFATGLNASQKRQIRDSLTRAREAYNDRSSHFTINKWLLTLPLDPTKEQLEWLAEEAASLGVPFEVEWRGRSFLDGLAADNPQVIDYYLRDGKDRLQEAITVLRDLAQFSPSRATVAVEPNDVPRRLAVVLRALNGEDPHYRYDFEVTAGPPIYFERPYLVASITDHFPGQYITFHVYARYVDAPEDRPIPKDFQVSREKLTPEASAAVDEMLRYGTQVEITASSITGLNIGMPAGLGFTNSTGVVRLGRTHGNADEPSRVALAIVAADRKEPLARLTFEMEAPTRGRLGGLFVRGVDTTGIVAVAIRIDPIEDEDPKIGLSVTLIDPQGKPVQQVLPGLRFIQHFQSPNRLAFGPEYGPPITVDSLHLPDGLRGMPIPIQVLTYAEALSVVSHASGLPVKFPDLTSLTNDDYREIIGIGNLLRGDHVRLTWSAITARIRPGSIEIRQTIDAQPMVTAQDLAVNIMGTEHHVGRVFTHLLSARIVGDLMADPGADGNIEIMIVPGDNDQAIMTTEALTPESVQRYSGDSPHPSGRTL